MPRKLKLYKIKNKNLNFIILIFFFILLGIFLFLFSYYSKSPLRACPEKWLINSFQGNVEEVLIYNGERKNKEEFDLTWVYSNCNLTKEILN